MEIIENGNDLLVRENTIPRKRESVYLDQKKLPNKPISENIYLKYSPSLKGAAPSAVITFTLPGVANGSHDSNPSVLNSVLPTVQSEMETTNVRRSKTDPLTEERNIASKLQNFEYTSVSQIEVPSQHTLLNEARRTEADLRMIYL